MPVLKMDTNIYIAIITKRFRIRSDRYIIIIILFVITCLEIRAKMAPNISILFTTLVVFLFPSYKQLNRCRWLACQKLEKESNCVFCKH